MMGLKEHVRRLTSEMVVAGAYLKNQSVLGSVAWRYVTECYMR